MGELQVIYLPLSALTPDDKNAKQHPADQVEQIKESIKTFKMCDPIGIAGDENLIIEGHGRYMALQELGVKEAPCIRLDHLDTAEKRKAYALIHNKTTMNSGFDIELLDMNLAEIETIDMGLYGFGEIEAEPITTQEDNYDAEPPAEPKAKRGDVYQLGRHRLMCGDSTNADDVKTLMDGKTAELLFTSPPYSNLREYEGNKDLSVENLAQFIGVYKPYCNFECVNLGIQHKNKEVFPYWDVYIDTAHKSGLKLLSWNVWNKQTAGNIGMQTQHMFPIIHEWIFVFGEDIKKPNRTKAKKESSIHKEKRFTTVREADGTIHKTTRGDESKKYKIMESVINIFPENGAIRAQHPATFPVKLPAEYIQALTNENENVIEPFGGSGTTLIACEQTNRNCFCMELEPKYIDVIINRWEEFTSKKAVKLN